MKVLLIGAGGREHALAWAIAKSKLLTKLYCAPGNAGMAEVGECVALAVADHGAVIAFCREHDISLVVVGPEAPLVAGLVDDLEAAGIAAFGPSAAAARLEGSKRFTKELCERHGIPTAAYAVFKECAPALAYVREKGAPIVVKADGLAAGKGVTVADTLEVAEQAIEAIFAGAFGEAGAEVVVEEYLPGEEASFFVLSDGQTILPLTSAQDHKRAFDGDQGPNTGGMGAYSPAPVMSEQIVERTLRDIVEPTIRAMADAGTPYKGVLYVGLMIDAECPKLIEYNVRFGDPECQVLAMRLKSDILPLLLASATGRLAEERAEWHDQAALTVVMATRGYPGSYARGSEIKGLEAIGNANVAVFHAGTVRKRGKLLASGGRVLNVTARGTTVGAAQARAYRAVRDIDWSEGFYRTDIGWRAVAREKESDA
jgi:phosphoribosylamine--glycine ligase